ncbi:unnamed protein product [Leptidea sinapis]|uniref:Beta-1,4-galactosyltransferase 7 n=1 Tax=Leptidea sinapis TaxID=189913 RepID=A0A5E4QE04_9NEOP|nr:unnamed protein product [Leptidea sinapis]
MGYKITCSKCLTICIGISFMMACFIATIPIQSPEPQKLQISTKLKKLAILVPFRDRFEELLEFVPHMFNFLQNQGILFDIFVIQQKDLNRFNRASLINVGFIFTRDKYDYIAMHDVDLLPINENLKYIYPRLGPMHISSPKTHPKYHYDTFIGGILLITKEHFELVKGMSNNYWGWGLEDDEFYVRLKDAGLKVFRPENITTGIENTFRDRITGVHDVKYSIYSTNSVVIDKLPITVINVELICDKNITPWCQCPEPVNVKKNR